MKLVSAPPTFISATLQPQGEDFQNENRKFGSGCEYAIRCLSSNVIQWRKRHGVGVHLHCQAFGLFY